MKGSIYRSEGSRAALAGFMDAVMAQWPYPYEAREVPTRFGATHVVTAGDRANPALILLHGSASNLLSWGGDIPRYAQAFFVVAPDIPGEAGKSAETRPSWENDGYAGWLDDLLDALGIGEACLLGISLGGWIAMKYGICRCRRVRRLALVTPGGLVPARISTVLKTILYTMQKDGQTKMKRLVFGTDDIHPAVGAFFDLVQAHFLPRFGSPPVFSDGEIRSVAAPVFMLSGGKDAFFAVEKAAKRLKKLLPRSDVHIIPEGEHGITDSAERISAFLGSN